VDLFKISGKEKVLFDFLGRELLEIRNQAIIRDTNSNVVLDVIPGLVGIQQAAPNRGTDFKCPSKFSTVGPLPDHVVTKVAVVIPALPILSYVTFEPRFQMFTVKPPTVNGPGCVDMVPDFAIRQNHFAVDRPPVIKQTFKLPAAVGIVEPPACTVAITLHKAALVDVAVRKRAEASSMDLPFDKLTVIIRTILELEQAPCVVLVPEETNFVCRACVHLNPALPLPQVFDPGPIIFSLQTDVFTLTVYLVHPPLPNIQVLIWHLH